MAQFDSNAVCTPVLPAAYHTHCVCVRWPATHCVCLLQRTQELLNMVKTELSDLVEIAGALRLWLQFNIPHVGEQDFDARIKVCEPPGGTGASFGSHLPFLPLFRRRSPMKCNTSR